jgi:sentrin-specific protease 7
MRLGTLHSKVFQTLREYLSCEYEAKMGKARDFTVESMPACCPKVPQQPNFTDCGIFVLQYVESFFKVNISILTYKVTIKHFFLQILIIH